MPEYRRPTVAGAVYFLTIVTHGRRPILVEPPARRALRAAIGHARQAKPFGLLATVLLPDHLHLMVALPAGDEDVSGRVTRIKTNFTRRYLDAGGCEAGQSRSRCRHRHRGVWQKRFHDHLIRDAGDFVAHLDYLHFNPVRHGFARCPHAWPFSTFRRLVRRGTYEARWCCTCSAAGSQPPRRLIKLPTAGE